jgi:hypothetical protein
MSKDTTEASEELRKEFTDIWQQLTKSEWHNSEPEKPSAKAKAQSSPNELPQQND